jgi:hypothetical protein
MISKLWNKCFGIKSNYNDNISNIFLVEQSLAFNRIQNSARIFLLKIVSELKLMRIWNGTLKLSKSLWKLKLSYRYTCSPDRLTETCTLEHVLTWPANWNVDSGSRAQLTWSLKLWYWLMCSPGQLTETLILVHVRTWPANWNFSTGGSRAHLTSLLKRWY